MPVRPCIATGKGGAWNNDLMKLYAKTLPLEHEMFELLRKSYAEGVTEEEKVALGEQRMTLAEKEKEEKIRFIKGNPSSYGDDVSFKWNA